MKFSPRLIAPVCAIGLMIVISGCGQKGRLVMPVRPPAISTPYPVAQPKPAPESDTDQTDTSAPTSEIKPDTPNVTSEPAKESVR